MKRFALFQTVLAILFLSVAVSSISAQRNFGESEDQPAPTRVNLMRELNLTDAQIRRIRQINRERQPVNRAARQRLQIANRALDEAIYADDLNEAEIQRRLRETQAAQAEMINNRTATETAIRQVLSPAQLVRFRELRARFGQRPKDRLNREQNTRRRLPLRRLGNRRRPPQ